MLAAGVSAASTTPSASSCWQAVTKRELRVRGHVGLLQCGGKESHEQQVSHWSHGGGKKF